jgi:hypothetical protein
MTFGTTLLLRTFVKFRFVPLGKLILLRYTPQPTASHEQDECGPRTHVLFFIHFIITL